MMPLPHTRLPVCWPEEQDGELSLKRFSCVSLEVSCLRAESRDCGQCVLSNIQAGGQLERTKGEIKSG